MAYLVHPIIIVFYYGSRGVDHVDIYYTGETYVSGTHCILLLDPPSPTSISPTPSFLPLNEQTDVHGIIYIVYNSAILNFSCAIRGHLENVITLLTSLVT